MAQLILVRHGESEWNAKGLWTGLTDISLSAKGKDEAFSAALLIKKIPIQIAFTSSLSRAKETLTIILDECGDTIPVNESSHLNERDYGQLTGKNKWDIQKEYGEKEFLRIRRGWDVPIPEGETLKDVYNRVIPYYKEHILPQIQKNNTCLIVAHGNSLRALVKELEKISDDNISHVEIKTGEVWVYTLTSSGDILKKEILSNS